ncbi:MbtH family protein [Kitasatospora sp. NPDC056327]|uniref:MbtH family protein n=1 Tax=Kitasatospora sp. NPDC056327 TaxID=3345785 RepID=UPI0035D935B9
MTNPFEDPGADYLVLVDQDGRHSLWPAVIAVPAGWRTTHGPAGREDCLAHVTAHWYDLGPAAPAGTR